jgi:hypothetical protein
MKTGTLGDSKLFRRGIGIRISDLNDKKVGAGHYDRPEEYTSFS